MICICQEVGLSTSIYLFGERIVSSVRVVTSAHWVTEQAFGEYLCTSGWRDISRVGYLKESDG